MSSCDLFFGTRHVALVLGPGGLSTDAVADAFRFTPTQTAHLRLIGVEPVLGATDALIRFDADLGTMEPGALEVGGVYRLVVEDGRAAQLAAMDAERRDALVREFNAMGAVANVIAPSVVIEFFSKQADLYLAASAPIFADNPDLGRAVRRTIRETICAQIGALLDQDVGNLGTITLDNFLAYKTAAQADPTPSSPRPSRTDARSLASLRLQSMLSRSRADDVVLSGVWDPNTDAVRSGPLDVQPLKKGSVVEIVTGAGADDDKDELDDDDSVEAGDDDDVVPGPVLAASAIIDGVKHRFILHSSGGQSINTVWLNVARRQIVLASRGLLTTRKTVIRYQDVRRCDDGAERDALCFSIVTARRAFHLQTSTARERDVWVAALNEIIAREGLGL